MDLSTGQEVHGKHFPWAKTFHSSVELTLQFSYLQMWVILYWVCCYRYIVQRTFATSSTNRNIDLLSQFRVFEERENLRLSFNLFFWYFSLFSQDVSLYLLRFFIKLFFWTQDRRIGLFEGKGKITT